MNITMIRQISGTRDGVDWPAPGESMDVPDEEAASLISNGLAKAADEAQAEAQAADEAQAEAQAEAPADEAPAGRKGARQATNEPA